MRYCSYCAVIKPMSNENGFPSTLTLMTWKALLQEHKAQGWVQAKTVLYKDADTEEIVKKRGRETVAFILSRLLS